VHHPIFARLYPRMARAMGRGGMAEHRAALLAGLTDEGIEIGAGSGANFAHYPIGVTSVLAVEPEPHLRAIAQQAAEHAPMPIEVVDGLVQQLPVGDGVADAVVSALVLCSIADPDSAFREIRRVLRPDGEFRFLGHVRADTPGIVRIQRLWTRRSGPASPAAAAPDATPRPRSNTPATPSNAWSGSASPICAPRRPATSWAPLGRDRSGRNGQAGQAPFEHAVREPAGRPSLGGEQPDGVVGEDAVRAAAVGHDLAVRR
jgi:SAM-dependent methyltransferase